MDRRFAIETRPAARSRCRRPPLAARGRFPDASSGIGNGHSRGRARSRKAERDQENECDHVGERGQKGCRQGVRTCTATLVRLAGVRFSAIHRGCLPLIISSSAVAPPEARPRCHKHRCDARRRRFNLCISLDASMRGELNCPIVEWFRPSGSILAGCCDLEHGLLRPVRAAAAVGSTGIAVRAFRCAGR